ncbi:LADA_0C10902g1_1 [Lachancea dasiensis]|uniref:LADA_0C10902g1_1 n=1 Tax=Lachancea dasiensis TaxID=1072105 RepID=A0A1G4J161_9SACH|nr:LADA_0C10902g1_1 [Lachancea dasiensis]
MSKLDPKPESDVALKTQSSVLLYHNAPTGLKTSQTAECCAFIRDKCLPAVIPQPNSGQLFIKYATKNTNTEEYVTEMVQQLLLNNTVVVYAYGPHIQRAITILELVKARAEIKKAHQTNSLDRFVNVVPGRNELLDRKINVPILIAVLGQEQSSP